MLFVTVGSLRVPNYNNVLFLKLTGDRDQDPYV